MKSFEDRIMDAVVQQFFQPSGTGTYSPVQGVVGQFYQLYGKEISQRIVEKIDTDSIVEAVANKIIVGLNEPGSYGPVAEWKGDLTRKVRDRLVTLLAERELTRLNAEAAEKEAKQ